jgi:predicted RND superfamily exporter protein
VGRNPWQDSPIAIFRSIIERGWWLILLALVGGAGWLATSIPSLEINATTDAFLEEEDTGITTYYEVREEWGTDEFAIFCVTADDWFTPEGMARLKAIEAEVKEVPFVASTMSIFDVPLLRQNPDQKPNLFRIKKSMVDLRDEGVDLAQAGVELREHELAKGNLISANGRSISILAYLDWSKTDGKLVPGICVRREKLAKGVRALADKWNKELPEPVRISGIPIIQRALHDNIRHDLIVFGIAALALFSLALFVVYRMPRFVVIPIVCCLLPAAGMLGAMSILGIPIALVTSNMPVLLFVLMLPYNVYFIERYRERRAFHPEEDGLASTLSALRTIVVPCFFSCATTLAGFVALATSKVIPIRDFGRTMTVGMLVGFAVVFLFLPAAMRRLRGSRVERSATGISRPSSGFVKLLQKITLARPGWIVIIGVVVLAVSIDGARRISAESKFTNYFWPSSEAYQGLEFIDQEVGGTTWIEVLLDSDEPGFFKKAEGIKALEVVEAYFQDLPETGNILSLNSLRNEMRKTFKPEWFPLMSDAALLTLVNISSPDLVSQTTNSSFSSSRATIRMKETAPTLKRRVVLDGLNKHLADHKEAFANLEVEITGVFPVYADMLTQLLEGQKQSIIVVPLAVFLMLLLLFRSPILALLVLLPQALPVAVLLGIMGWVGIPLDLVTVMIAAIAIGVGIDAAIQYTMRFREELAATGDHRAAVSRAHATIGRAIWTATTIIVAGFAILVLSRFFPTFWFGIFTAAAMLMSQLATLTMLPSLFLLTGYPKK